MPAQSPPPINSNLNAPISKLASSSLLLANLAQAEVYDSPKGSEEDESSGEDEIRSGGGDSNSLSSERDSSSDRLSQQQQQGLKFFELEFKESVTPIGLVRILVAGGKNPGDRSKLAKLLNSNGEKSSGSESSKKSMNVGRGGAVEGMTFLGNSNDEDSRSIYYEFNNGQINNSLQKSITKFKKLSKLTDSLVEEYIGGNDITACLYLFSAPPTAEELADSREISHYLPLIPILLLPPSNKTQKTQHLIRAVQIQLSLALVRYIPASRVTTPTYTNPFFILPHQVFERNENLNSSTESLSQPVQDDLHFLQRLNLVVLQREKLLSLKESMEIENGEMSSDIENVGVERRLEFSQRVLERKNLRLLRPRTPKKKNSKTDSITSADPINLPSFFNLVGLNLRMSLLKKLESNVGIGSWSVLFAFMAGFCVREIFNIACSSVIALRV